MWFIKFFIIAVGLELLYMLVMQETTSILRHGESYTIALKHHPVRFVFTFIMFLVFEVVLIKVHRDLAREKRDPRTNRRNRKRAAKE